MRKFSVILFVMISLTAWSFPGLSHAGKIKGTVQVRGLRSPENILIYLQQAAPVTIGFSGTKFTMDQRNLAFFPHVLPIPAGATVHFPNNDQVAHNVFSLSGTKKFNLGSYRPGEDRTVIFDRPGMVEVRCDVHAEMAAYVLVMKNPYFALTDEKGSFEIPDIKYFKRYHSGAMPDLAPGEYVINTWHEKVKNVRKTIQIQMKGEETVQLNLNRGIPGALYK
ncbi:MAG: hypothetical protein Q8P24_20170 [Desulfobacterales bacterium]|nr:hypothetical protein [Desulfobacterales bacterium]